MLTISSQQGYFNNPANSAVPMIMSPKDIMAMDHQDDDLYDDNQEHEQGKQQNQEQKPSTPNKMMSATMTMDTYRPRTAVFPRPYPIPQPYYAQQPPKLERSVSFSLSSFPSMDSLHSATDDYSSQSNISAASVPSVSTSSSTTITNTIFRPIYHHHHPYARIPNFHSKRKKSAPRRSLPQLTDADQKFHQGIVKLDVYSTYTSNPKKLLYNPKDYDEETILKLQQQRRMKRSASFSGTTSNTNQESTGPANRIARSASFSRMPTDATGGLETLNTELVTRKEYQDVSGVNVPKPVQSAKGTPLDIPLDAEGYDLLIRDEAYLCSILRIWPIHYLKIKETLLMHKENHGYFKKRDAQKLVRIDVNKTNKIYDWYIALGWIYGSPEQATDARKFCGVETLTSRNVEHARDGNVGGMVMSQSEDESMLENKEPIMTL